MPHVAARNLLLQMLSGNIFDNISSCGSISIIFLFANNISDHLLPLITIVSLCYDFPSSYIGIDSSARVLSQHGEPHIVFI
jgi:hypothetical protein